MSEVQTFTIFGEITEELSDYEELTVALMEAEEGDVIKIILNSEGGSVPTTAMIISAVHYSDATVMVDALGDCFSAAALLFLHIPNRRIAPSTLLMFHDVCLSPHGNPSIIVDQVEAESDRYFYLFNSVCEDVLTESEYDHIFKLGRDVYMSGDEYNRRMEELPLYERRTVEQDTIDDDPVH